MVVGDARQRLQWLLVGTPGSKVGEVAVVGPARSIWSDRSVRRSTRSRPRDSGEHDEIVEESPPTQRRTARRSEQPPVSQPAAGEEPVENAPRTHRLDQVTANNSGLAGSRPEDGARSPSRSRSTPAASSLSGLPRGPP